MIEVMIIGGASLLLFAFLGIAACWGLARLMDWANGRAIYRFGHASRWAGVLKTIESDPKASAFYYGCRWLGVCILVGWLFSRPV